MEVVRCEGFPEVVLLAGYHPLTEPPYSQIFDYRGAPNDLVDGHPILPGHRNASCPAGKSGTLVAQLF